MAGSCGPVNLSRARLNDRHRLGKLMAMDARSRPILRSVESIVVTDQHHGRVLVLRDTQGVTDAHAVIPPMLVPIVTRFTGSATCTEIARECSRELGSTVPTAVVVRLAEELERGLYLESPAFHVARARVEREFAEASVRPPSHAGGAYHRQAHALERYIDQECLAHSDAAAREGMPKGKWVDASAAGAGDRLSDGGQDGDLSRNGAAARSPTADGHRRMVGLVAPHIDPWRGAVGYGHAYGAMRDALPACVDTFVVLGTSHAPMREPFALCRKGFDTPFGLAPADTDAIDSLAACAAGFDPYADQFNHKREHSLEFQVVFLKHLLKQRDFRIVPVLAGLGLQQSTGVDPDADPRVTRFLDGMRALVESRAGRIVVVAGADLAHVGPRFGDEVAYGHEQRAHLGHADRASLDRATSLDAKGFWAHVAGDLESRRVCGLAPIWSLLSVLKPTAATGRVLHYEQTVDKTDGSNVSHAAVGFYA